MKVNEWPLTDGMFVYLTRPEDSHSMRGWHFVWHDGTRTFVHPDHDCPVEALPLELGWRIDGGVFDPLEAVEPGGDE